MKRRSSCCGRPGTWIRQFPFANSYLGLHYASVGKFAEALPFAEKAYKLIPWAAQSAGVYAGLLHRMGQPDRATEVLESISSHGIGGMRAVFHTIAGDIDQAAEWYAKALAEREATASQFLQSAIGEPVRASRHWPRLAALLNLRCVDCGTARDDPEGNSREREQQRMKT